MSEGGRGARLGALPVRGTSHQTSRKPTSVSFLSLTTHSLPFFIAVAAIVCTRSEAELAGIFESLSELGGIEFYSFNTLGQILRHLLLKVSEEGGPNPAWCLVHHSGLLFKSGTLLWLACLLLLQGTLQDHQVLQDRLRRILGEMTFAEAYQRSGG